MGIGLGVELVGHRIDPVAAIAFQDDGARTLSLEPFGISRRGNPAALENVAVVEGDRAVEVGSSGVVHCVIPWSLVSRGN